METHLANSQLLSRKDVRLRFRDGKVEYSGECKVLADNGMIFQARVTDPGHLASLKNTLIGKKLAVELSSKKARGEVSVQFQQVAMVSASKGVLSIVATYTEPPDKEFMRLLLEPVLIRVSKRG